MCGCESTLFAPISVAAARLSHMCFVSVVPAVVVFRVFVISAFVSHLNSTAVHYACVNNRASISISFNCEFVGAVSRPLHSIWRRVSKVLPKWNRCIVIANRNHASSLLIPRKWYKIITEIYSVKTTAAADFRPDLRFSVLTIQYYYCLQFSCLACAHV